MGLTIWTWGTRRSSQTVVFNNVVNRVEFGVAAPVWTLSPPGVTHLEVFGCRVPLDHLRGVSGGASRRQEVAFAAGSAVTPGNGVVLRLDVDGFATLQADRQETRLGLSAANGVAAPGLRVDFEGSGVNTLLASVGRVRVLPDSGLRWENTRPPSESEPVELTGLTRGLVIECPGRASRPVTERPWVLLQEPGGGEKAADLKAGLQVFDPTLDGPNGSIQVGSRSITLYGGGTLGITSASPFTLGRLRWTPGSDPSLAVSIGGRSNDVRLDEEPLVPSMLAELAQEPRWTTFAAVMAVFLGALVGKLFELAIPTK